MYWRHFCFFMKDIALKDLLEAGCHFGHKADRWHPKANAFIYQEREGIHVIDLAKTRDGLLKAAQFLAKIGEEGGTVLFVGTKRQASAIIREEAEKAGLAYINRRWIGGFLTNWETIHKNLEKIRKLTEEQKTGAWNKYPKHERVKLARYLTKLNYFYGGVVALMKPPQALFVVDIKREAVAVAEAHTTNTPVVGIVDTNSDPSEVTYVVPANDDAVGSVKLIVNFLAQAYAEGKSKYDKQIAQEAKKVEAEKIKAETEKAEEKTAVSAEPVKVDVAVVPTKVETAAAAAQKTSPAPKKVTKAVKPKAKATTDTKKE